MDKGSQTSMTIARMRDGGYVVSKGVDPMQLGHYNEPVFASHNINDCLKFIHDAIVPVDGPQPPSEESRKW